MLQKHWLGSAGLWRLVGTAAGGAQRTPKWRGGGASGCDAYCGRFPTGAQTADAEAVLNYFGRLSGVGASTVARLGPRQLLLSRDGRADEDGCRAK